MACPQNCFQLNIAPPNSFNCRVVSSRRKAEMSDEQDPKKKSPRYDSSRRKFLKGVGVAGAGAALADHFISTDKAVAQIESVTTGAPVAGTVNIALDVNG